MELFVTRNGNSWELLLIVAIRELCLKCDRAPRSDSETYKFTLGIKYSIWHLHVQSQQKNNRTLCQIYSKLTIKTPEWYLVILLLTLHKRYISQTLNNNPSNIPKILVSNDRTSTELIEIANILNNFCTFNAA